MNHHPIVSKCLQENEECLQRRRSFSPLHQQNAITSTYQYHPLLLASISPFPAKALHCAIQQPGNLTLLLTCANASYSASLLPDDALAHLLSALYDEMKKESNNIRSILNFLCRVFRFREDIHASIKELIFSSPEDILKTDNWVATVTFMIVYDTIFRFTSTIQSKEYQMNESKEAALKLFKLLMSPSMNYNAYIQKRLQPYLLQIERYQREGDNCNGMEYLGHYQILSASKLQFGQLPSQSVASYKRIKTNIKTDELESILSRGGTKMSDFDSYFDSDIQASPENPLGRTSIKIANEHDENDQNVLILTNTITIADALQQDVIKLSAQLSLLSPQTTSSENEEFAKQIVEILNRAMNEGGLAGMEDVMKLITIGVLHDRPDVEQKDSKFILQESTASATVRLFISSKTSVVRATSLLSYFLLPLLVKNSDTAPSRSMVSLITDLTKVRPAEVINAIFLPLLSPPKKCGCDLLLRVFKILPRESIHTLFINISNIEVKHWNDSLISLVTSLNKVNLSNDIVKKLSSIIVTLARSRAKADKKLSSLFLAFIKQHGVQIKNLSLVEELKNASGKFPTFVSKAISNTLDKL